MAINPIDNPVPNLQEDPPADVETPEFKDIENKARIESNLQIMMNAEKPATAQELQNYLKRVERVDMGFGEPDPKASAITTRPDTQSGLALEAIRGGIKGTLSMAALPAIVLDYSNYLVGQALNYAQTSAGFEATNFNSNFTGAIMEDVEGFDTFLNPNLNMDGTSKDGQQESGLARAVHRAGQYVGPGALITRGMTLAGARLISSAPEAYNIFQRMFIEVAKNPVRAQALEAGFATGSAVVGEAAVTAAKSTGNPEAIENAEWTRLGAEMTTLSVGMVSQSLIRNLTQFARKKLVFTEAHRKIAAERLAAEHFSNFAAVDDQLVKHLDDSIAAADESGIAIMSGDATGNPGIAAAQAAVTETVEGSSSRLLRVYERGARDLVQIRKDLQPIINGPSADLRANLDRFVKTQVGKLEKRADKAVREAMDEAARLNPGRSQKEIGEAAILELQALEKIEIDAAEALYDLIDNSVTYPTAQINRGMSRAGMSRLARQTNDKRALTGTTDVERAPLLNVANFGKIPAALHETFQNFFGKKNPRQSLLIIREWRQEINAELRVASRNGDTDTMDRLLEMRNGVDRQFKFMTRGAQGQEKIHFQKANEYYEAVKDRFDRSFANVMSDAQIAGRDMLYPEDFGKYWIRPKSRVANETVVADYRRAFGDSESSRLLIRDSVASTIKDMTDDAGRLNMEQITSWLNARKKNLQAHGVWEHFDTVGKAEFAAREAVEATVVARKDFADGLLGQILGAGNVKQHLLTQLKNGRLGEVRRTIDGMKNLSVADSRIAMESFNRNVWDAVIENAAMPSLNRDGRQTFSPDKIQTLLLEGSETRAQLIQGLGKKHVESLDKLAVLFRFNDGMVGTGGTRPIDMAVVKGMDQQQVGRALSKIRASLQGFVSPQYTGVQLLNQAMDLISGQAAAKVVEEAMFNPKYLKELIVLGQTNAGKEALRRVGSAWAYSVPILPAIADGPFNEDR